MPTPHALRQVLTSELGPDWESRLASFDPVPVAAASIGQVHRGELPDGRAVAVKVQYPGVARSIESDVDNLMRVVRFTSVLPPTLFAANLTRVAKAELALECDYEYEAASQARYAACLAGEPDLASRFRVPAVVPGLSSRAVLTSEWVPGVHIDAVAGMDQATRDEVGGAVLALTLRELFAWRFMQTDPNWGNFLYDPGTGVISLVDFGAAREFPVSFVREYISMVDACARRDRDGIIRHSLAMGFLTGAAQRAHARACVRRGACLGACMRMRVRA